MPLLSPLEGITPCAVTAGGGVKCWGANTAGQLGVNPGWTPRNVVGLTDPTIPRRWFPLMFRRGQG